MPKVSIVVPVYNAADKINRCVESICSQTFSDIEVILVDDGSTDDSLSACEKIAQSDNRIRIFHQENAGVSAARNQGIGQAVGEWLMFADADDWVEPSTVNDMVHLVEEDNANIGVCSFYSEFADGCSTVKLNNETLSVSQILTEYTQNSRFETILCTVWNKIYRREIIHAHSIRFEEGIRFGEDFIFNARCFQHIQTVKTTEAMLYHYDCTAENSGVNKLYSNYDAFIYAMDLAVRSLLDTVPIDVVKGNAFREKFVGSRLRYAIDVCLTSAISIESQGELICKWVNAMPLEMRLWKTLNDGEAGRLLQLWSNGIPSVPEVCKEIGGLRKVRRRREKILRCKRFVRKIIS